MPYSSEENLLEKDPPPGGKHLERIHFLAKVLAYGALTNQWSPRFSVRPKEANDIRRIIGENWETSGLSDYNKRLDHYLNEKWGYQLPLASLLESLRYLERQETVGGPLGRTYYILTPQAYALLERPKIPPKVFISYCHKTSSAFAMAIEYRLQALQIPVFIDRSIPKGDDWHNRLKTTVQSCQYFVCLITEEALESEFVRSEIQWAEEQRRIPIWHPGFGYDKDKKKSHPIWLREFVESKQAIRVFEESSEAYHDAIEKLLNELGFALPEG